MKFFLHQPPQCILIPFYQWLRKCGMSQGPDSSPTVYRLSPPGPRVVQTTKPITNNVAKQPKITTQMDLTRTAEYHASSLASGQKRATRAPKNDVSNARRFFLLFWDNVEEPVSIEQGRNIPSSYWSWRSRHTRVLSAKLYTFSSSVYRVWFVFPRLSLVCHRLTKLRLSCSRSYFRSSLHCTWKFPCCPLIWGLFSNSNSVIQPYFRLGWWQWIYHLLPYTYLVALSNRVSFIFFPSLWIYEIPSRWVRPIRFKVTNGGFQKGPLSVEGPSWCKWV